MLIKCILAVAAFASGIAVSSGVFTVFTAVGLVPRFADKTKSARKVTRYESMIILGTFFGLLLSVYYDFFLGMRLQLLPAGKALALTHGLLSAVPSLSSAVSGALLVVYGLFTGAYIGCLALSIAEIFDAIPIMTRRVKLKKGLGLMIFCLAVGKLLGGLLFCSSIKPLH